MTDEDSQMQTLISRHQAKVNTSYDDLQSQALRSMLFEHLTTKLTAHSDVFNNLLIPLSYSKSDTIEFLIATPNKRAAREAQLNLEACLGTQNIVVSNWVPNPALHSDFAQHVDDYFSGPVLHIAPLETVELNIGFYYSSLKNLATYWSQTPSRTHQSNGFGALISLFDRSIQNRSFRKSPRLLNSNSEPWSVNGIESYLP